MTTKVKSEMLNVECSMLNVEWIREHQQAGLSTSNIQHLLF